MFASEVYSECLPSKMWVWSNPPSPCNEQNFTFGKCCPDTNHENMGEQPPPAKISGQVPPQHMLQAFQKPWNPPVFKLCCLLQDLPQREVLRDWNRNKIGKRKSGAACFNNNYPQSSVFFQLQQKKNRAKERQRKKDRRDQKHGGVKQGEIANPELITIHHLKKRRFVYLLENDTMPATTFLWIPSPERQQNLDELTLKRLAHFFSQNEPQSEHYTVRQKEKTFAETAEAHASRTEDNGKYVILIRIDASVLNGVCKNLSSDCPRLLSPKRAETSSRRIHPYTSRTRVRVKDPKKKPPITKIPSKQ